MTPGERVVFTKNYIAADSQVIALRGDKATVCGYSALAQMAWVELDEPHRPDFVTTYVGLENIVSDC
jgi:hypothetical protein